MGFFRSAWDWVCDKVEKVKDFLGLGEKEYSRSIEDQIDVDKVLADFRASIQPDVSKTEKQCMMDISTIFDGLKTKTKTRFPDLVEIIQDEQNKAKRDLEGTVMQYVKEHLSKNDSEFLKVLKMQPGKAKTDALGMKAERVIERAEVEFNKKLKKYAEHIMSEFTSRLDTRIINQEKEMKSSIEKMEKLEEEANEGKIDIDSLRDKCAPIMESAECILNVLEMET